MNPNTDLKSLEQPTRRRIVEHLRLIPGDHFRSIMRSLQLPIGSTRHHLAVLTKKGFVQSERMAGKVRYFATAAGSGPSMNDTFRQYWKYRDLRARVWSALVRTPDLSPSAVAAAVGISRQLAFYHLRCLVESGLVTHSRGRYRALNRANPDPDSSPPRPKRRTSSPNS